MDPYASNRRVILDKDLEQIAKSFPEFLQRTEESILCIKECLQELKEYICKQPFSSREEEIFFFKEIKPAIFCKLIYFVEVYKIESKRPVGNKSNQKKYLLREQKKIRSFFDENKDFYTYYRNKSTHLDEKYFLRNKLDIHLCPDDYMFNTDPCFSTSHDYKVARIIANDMLNDYLNNELRRIEMENESPLLVKDSCRFVWTDSKISLIELIYAIHASGCVNNGNTDIKELAKLVETIFNIELGDIYRTYIEIKTRHIPTKFLDTLRSALNHKIQEQDG